MGDLTKNISRHELICKCGDCNVTILKEEPVINVVQDTCDHFAEEYETEKVTLIINRGASCYTYNRSKEIGSNDNSQHPRACAIDFKIFVEKDQVAPSVVNKYLNEKYPNSLGLGLYTTFNHVDTRPQKARWSRI